MQTQLTTITQHQVTVAFADESEARQFLADAAPAQDAVRAQLASVHANGNGALHADLGMPKPARKTSAKKVGGGKTRRALSAEGRHEGAHIPLRGVRSLIHKRRLPRAA